MERGGFTLAAAFIAGILFAFLFPLPLSAWSGLLFSLLPAYARLYYCLFYPRKNISPHCRPLWGKRRIKRSTAVRYFITTGHLILIITGAIHLCQNPAYRRLANELSLQTAITPQRERRKTEFYRHPAKELNDSMQVNGRYIKTDTPASGNNLRKRKGALRIPEKTGAGPHANSYFRMAANRRDANIWDTNIRDTNIRDVNIKDTGPHFFKQLFSILKNRLEAGRKVTGEKIQRLNYSSPRTVLAQKTGRIRNLLADRLKKLVPSEAEYSVLSALTLGDKSGIPRDLKQAYKNSGAMHVLALSGLHTGILYTIIGILFLPLDFHYKTRRIKRMLSLAFIAFYAVITGMNAPVLRAGIMIGIYRATATGRRTSGKWNAVCLAAGSILLFSPLELFKIGFQLSFAAVCGIAGLYPVINGRAKLKSKLTETIRSLLSVSVSCQIATAPLVYLYFKNIPWFKFTYFACAK